MICDWMTVLKRPNTKTTGILFIVRLIDTNTHRNCFKFSSCNKHKQDERTAHGTVRISTTHTQRHDVKKL